jgi:hypothetical protein
LNMAVWRSEVADSVREVAFFVRNYLVAAGVNVRIVPVDDGSPVPGLLYHPDADLAIDIMHASMPGLSQMVGLALSLAPHPISAESRAGDAASRARILPLTKRLRDATDSTRQASAMRELAVAADSAMRTVALWWQPELVGCSLRVSACPRSVVGNRFDSVSVRPSGRRD